MVMTTGCALDLGVGATADAACVLSVPRAARLSVCLRDRRYAGLGWSPASPGCPCPPPAPATSARAAPTRPSRAPLQAGEGEGEAQNRDPGRAAQLLRPQKGLPCPRRLAPRRLHLRRLIPSPLSSHVAPVPLPEPRRPALPRTGNWGTSCRLCWGAQAFPALFHRGVHSHFLGGRGIDSPPKTLKSEVFSALFLP